MGKSSFESMFEGILSSPRKYLDVNLGRLNSLDEQAVAEEVSAYMEQLRERNNRDIHAARRAEYNATKPSDELVTNRGDHPQRHAPRKFAIGEQLTRIWAGQTLEEKGYSPDEVDGIFARLGIR